MRHGYHDLTDKNLPDDINVDNDKVKELPMFEYRIKPEFAGYTIIIICKILTGRYKNWFIGEEYHGAHHPMLLIPPDDVYKS